jgi:cell division protease FtsH
MSRTPSPSDPPQEARGYSQMDPPGDRRKPPLGNLRPKMRFSLAYYLATLAAFLLLQWFFFSGVKAPEMPYSEFRTAVASGRVAQVVLTQNRIYGQFRPPEAKGPAPKPGLELPATKAPWHLGRIVDSWKRLRGDLEREEQAREAEAKLDFTVVPLDDPTLLAALQEHGVEYRGRIESNWFRGLLLNWIVPFGAMFLLWGFLMRRMGRGPNVLQMGQSRAKIYEVDPATRVHFTDLAGVDEAIEETREIVSFLHDPSAFTKLGAKLPKGVLLVGPPGTGKTLLARAIAGEAEVPFYSLSGSDFVEMFVGVGAARVRDLFAEAKKSAPCIVFIDELDAIGKTRAAAGAFAGGGYDERENTLNQLLVELDGFDGSSGVVILAATNRPEVLDRALLRPGRFDRRVVVDRPSRPGRRAIFRIHTRKLPLGDDIDFEALAAQTPGMVGADIANVCNEAALLASREGRSRIAMADFQEAIERTISGPQKKSQIVTPEERQRIAYHESGHALVGHMTPGGDPVQKISIIPRAAGSLGYTLQMPLEDRYVLAKDELLDRVRVLLAGRAAEEVVFGTVSTGASDDLEKASEIVREMLTVYGMSEKAPHLSLVAQGRPGSLVGGIEPVPRSEELSRALDAEVIALLGHCYEEARSLLLGERDRLEALAKRLLEVEELDRAGVLALLGDRPAEAPWQRLSAPAE